jgi:putative nucleotidyltransferase with HDIG domain
VSSFVPHNTPPQPNTTGRFGHFPSAAKNLLQRSVKDVPALPQVVHHILSLFGKTETSTAQIAKMISLDPGLTARVLRMVNSSAYGFQRQITSIQHAIALLGFTSVQGLVLSASICNLFKPFTPKQGRVATNPTATGEKNQQPSLNVHDFWRHSLLVALLAKRIAHLYRIPNEEEVFSAAILHDIGHLILHHYAPELDITVARNLKQAHLAYDTAETLEVESRLLGFNHCELGQELATKWKLPQLMAEVMTFHHAPQLASEGNSAVYCVALADYLTQFHTEDTPLMDNITRIQHLYKHLNPAVASYFSIESPDDLRGLISHENQLADEARELQLLFDSEAMEDPSVEISGTAVKEAKNPSAHPPRH